jgi:hypothetical protein
MRAPVVAGVGGGVGTTTVAVGLRGHDAGRVAGLPPGHRPDILVCRATSDSVHRAAAVLDEPGHEPPPVLAVTLMGVRAPRGPLRGRLELLEADTAALVLLPHVRRWAALVDPLGEAAQLLVEPVAQLPRPLRAYAAALRELAAAVANSGQLGHDAGSGPRFPSDDRHARRTGHDERAVREDGRGFGAPARPPAVGPREPIGSRASSGVDRAPAGPTPHSPQRRQGVRIVTPGGLPTASGRRMGRAPDVRTAAARPPDGQATAEGGSRPARRVAPAIQEAAAGAGDRQSGKTADVTAERVGQVG